MIVFHTGGFARRINRFTAAADLDESSRIDSPELIRLYRSASFIGTPIATVAVLVNDSEPDGFEKRQLFQTTSWRNVSNGDGVC
ncbi:hypothetical protein [Novipirellula sp.]|uniref:hypothetical protein n=1 Tax=Novipirellula sp. TaxID=2795430 RepID=UPI003565F3E5